jgi:hypothetical protein
MKEVIAYKCEFCSKLYEKRANLVKHAPVCKKNPVNFRPCFACKFSLKVYMPIVIENSVGYEQIIEERIIICDKLKRGIYPPKVERHKTLDAYSISDNHLGITENLPMPKECDSYEDFEF